MMTDHLADLDRELAAFLPKDARAQSSTAQVRALLRARGRAAFDRSAQADHITASGFVLSPDRRQVLLMHHRKLDIWLQPGGHCDGDTDVRAVAAREVSEEIGNTTARLISRTIFDVDVHDIPARNTEPAHRHHDIRFLFEVDPGEPLPGNVESHALRWLRLDEMSTITNKPSVLVVRHALVQPGA